MTLPLRLFPNHWRRPEMAGAYLLALLLSFAGVLTLDARFRLAGWTDPRRTALAVSAGTGFFLLWDAVGIAAGVFVRGDSPLLLGIDLAPHLPLEEPVFLAFLCYLALVLHAAARRALSRRSPEPSTRAGS